MTVSRGAIVIPDSTRATVELLRGLRRGRGRKQAASVAYWVYLAAIIAVGYGGSLIVAAVRALRHPPPPAALTPHVLLAAPAGLAALALAALLMLVRDALWRGPVTVPPPTADWLLGTPVDRGRLLRPRFRMNAALTVVAGAAAGIVPAAILVSTGLGGHDTGHVLRLTAAAMGSAALLVAFGTGCAGLVERYQASWPRVRAVTPVAGTAAGAFLLLVAWALAGRPPAVLSTVVLWSGPWGWAAQPVLAAVSGPVAGFHLLWPLAAGLLAAAALVALGAAHSAAAGVPAAALRLRARTLRAMSTAVLSMNTRGVARAYSGAASSRRARFRLPPPRHRALVLPWRDLLALARAPYRLVAAVVLTLLAVGLLGLAAHGRQPTLVPVACALTMGYLAAAWLCEGARLDADDPRRSAALPFRFDTLAWWHAIMPCLLLLAVAGLPVIVLAVASGHPWFLVLLLVTVPVLVGGALVNVFRGELSPNALVGFDTPLGNTAALTIGFWAAWGPVLAIAPMTVLMASAIGAPGKAGPLDRAVLLGIGLAVGIGAYARRRAARLRAG